MDSSNQKQDSHTDEGSDLVDLNFISDLLVKEIQIPILQFLPPDTYKSIAMLIRKLVLQTNDNLESKIKDEIVRLSAKAAQLLLEIRCQKLIVDWQNDSDLPPVFATEQYSKLTEEEKYIVDSYLESFRKKRSIILAASEGREKMLKTLSKMIYSRKIIVRFLKPIEQFMGVDMTKYGPFIEEDVAILPFENARSLIELGTVMEIRDDTNPM
jgi:DNA replication factor GINS